MILNRLIYLSCGFIAGIVLRTFLPFSGLGWVAWILLVLAGMVAGWVFYRELKWQKQSRLNQVIPILIFAACIGFLRTDYYLQSAPAARAFFSGLPKNSLITMEGVVSAEPEMNTNGRLTLRLTLDKVKKAGEESWQPVEPVDIKLSAYQPKRMPEAAALCRELADYQAYGYKLKVTGIYRAPQKALNPGSFDEELFYMAEKFIGSVRVYDWQQPKARRGDIAIIEKSSGNILMEWAMEAKRHFVSAYKAYILPPENRLVCGATLGIRSAVKGQFYREMHLDELFKHAGVGHVLAVSGLHISVVSLLLYTLFRLTKLPPKYFAPLVILLLVCFTLLTGARPSSVRATIMNAFIICMFVYFGSGFKTATFAGLGLASLLILNSSPFVLYSAGFLLSFGAVLSLVLLTTPIDRILCQMRGAVLLLITGCFAGVLVYACFNWVQFVKWESLLLCVALVIAAIQLGSVLNRKYPALTAIAFWRIPKMLRLFLCAQGAIQIGMMIPMSAYFFGHYPIAGIFVNLVAIPLVAILVQLGILIGLVSLIPGIGGGLALCLGASEYLISNLFIFTAWCGAQVFPFPAVPIPSSSWFVSYYLVLLALLIVYFTFPQWQTWIFKLYRRSPHLVSKGVPAGCIIMLLAVAGFRARHTSDAGMQLDVLGGSDMPVICFTGGDHHKGAIVINSGNGFFAQSSLQNFLLYRKSCFIEDYIVTGYKPDLGSAGVNYFLPKFKINTLYYPTPEKGAKTLPQYGDAADYYSAINEKKMASMARKKKTWALRQYCVYESMVDRLADTDTAVKLFQVPEKLTLNQNTQIEFIARPYRSSAAGFIFSHQGQDILVVGDGANKQIASVVGDGKQFKALVLGGPTRTNARYYLKGLKRWLHKIKINTIVLCVDERNSKYRNVKTCLGKVESLCRAMSNVSFYRTDQTGNVVLPLTEKNHKKQ